MFIELGGELECAKFASESVCVCVCVSESESMEMEHKKSDGLKWKKRL